MMTNGKRFQGLRRSKRREQILAVAASIIAIKGYPQTSLQDIATGVKLRKQSLYHYFTNKEDLFYQILEAAVSEGIERLREVNRLPLGPAAKLRQMIITHASLFSIDQDLMKVFAREKWDMLNQKRRVKIKDLEREYDSIVQDILYEGVREKVFRADIDVKITAFAIIGMLYHMAKWYSPSGRLPIEKIGDTWVTLVQEGVFARALDDGAKTTPAEAKLVTSSPIVPQGSKENDDNKSKRRSRNFESLRSASGSHSVNLGRNRKTKG